MNTITLREKDDGHSYPANIGDLVYLELSEIPSTGYIWQVDGEFPALRLEKDTYKSTPSGTIGGTSTRVFVFKVVARGLTKLQLRLSRPWKTKTSIEKRYSIILDVAGDSDR